MIKVDNEWQECSWEKALHFAVDGIKAIVKDSGSDSLAALVSPSATTEEMYLAQKVVRGIGSNNIDHRLRQSDYATQELDPLFCGLSMPVIELAAQEAIFVIASNTSKEQPIIAHHIRQASLSGCSVSVLNPVDYPTNYPIDTKIITAPVNLFIELQSLCKALLEIDSKLEAPEGLMDLIGQVKVSTDHKSIINNLKNAEKSVVLLGSLSQTLPDYSAIRMLASFIAQHTDSKLSYLSSGANASGAYIAGAIPHRTECMEAQTQGLATQQMFDQQLNAYILHGIEAEYDIENPQKAIAALKSAFVVSISPYITDTAKDYADVLLPAAVYSESSGTFVNISGDKQSFKAVTNPLGESRPAWKIFRVLGNLFDLDNMDYISSEEVKDELFEKLSTAIDKQAIENNISWQCPSNIVHLNKAYNRIGDFSIYSVDSIVRRSEPLQQTSDGKNQNILKINSKMADSLKVNAGQQVDIKQAQTSCESTIVVDDSIPDDCIYFPHSTQQSSLMGCSFSGIELTPQENK